MIQCHLAESIRYDSASLHASVAVRKSSRLVPVLKKMTTDQLPSCHMWWKLWRHWFCDTGFAPHQTWPELISEPPAVCSPATGRRGWGSYLSTAEGSTPFQLRQDHRECSQHHPVPPAKWEDGWNVDQHLHDVHLSDRPEFLRLGNLLSEQHICLSSVKRIGSMRMLRLNSHWPLKRGVIEPLRVKQTKVKGENPTTGQYLTPI